MFQFVRMKGVVRSVRRGRDKRYLVFGFVRRKEVERSVRRGRDKRCGVEGLSLHPLLMVMERRAPCALGTQR